jgi:hypothetical protein
LETLRITLVEALELSRREALEAAGEAVRRDPDRRMKRQELSRHLRNHGGVMLREGVGIRGGTIPPETDAR